MNKLEWLKERQKGIGGSDVGAILGISKYKTQFQVYLEKTEPITEVGEQHESAYWGTQLEDMVAKEFALRTGKKVRKDNKHLVHKDYPFMVANIDRRVVGENAILECKTTSSYGAKEWDSGEVPASYLLQCQHYLAVTGAEKCYIACLIGGQKFVHYELHRDEDLINLIIEKEKEFWKMVEDRIPPTLDGSSAAEDWIKEKYKKTEPGTEIPLSSENKDKINNYLQLKDTIKSLETQLKEIENQIKYEIGEAEGGYINEFRIKWKPISKTTIDSKKLKSEMPEVYEKYSKTSEYRKFEIKEEKE